MTRSSMPKAILTKWIHVRQTKVSAYILPQLFDTWICKRKGIKRLVVRQWKSFKENSLQEVAKKQNKLIEWMSTIIARNIKTRVTIAPKESPWSFAASSSLTVHLTVNGWLLLSSQGNNAHEHGSFYPKFNLYVVTVS